MENFGDPSWISFVPGNHDAYVPVLWEQGLGHLAPYMTGDMCGSRPTFSTYRLNISLCAPAPEPGHDWLEFGITPITHQGCRHLGPKQLEALAKILRDLKAKGYYRAVMIHHPPLPGLAPPRKALSDAAQLARRALERRGGSGAARPQPP